MTKRSVVTLLTDEGLKTLQKQSRPVIFTTLGLDSLTKEIITQLKQYVIEHNGLGMAAIQLGEAIDVFVMRRANKIITIINPVILDKSTLNVIQPEGCFSIPLPAGSAAMVERSNTITVRYNNESGEQVIEALSGMEGRVFQHELDHLKGRLMIDENIFRGWGAV